MCRRAQTITVCEATPRAGGRLAQFGHDIEEKRGTDETNWAVAATKGTMPRHPALDRVPSGSALLLIAALVPASALADPPYRPTDGERCCAHGPMPECKKATLTLQLDKFLEYRGHRVSRFNPPRPPGPFVPTDDGPGKGGVFVEAADAWGVCPKLMVAIAMKETGGGVMFHGNDYYDATNVGGFTVDGEPKPFDSWDDSIWYLAELLATRYYDQTDDCVDPTPEEISEQYTGRENATDWSDEVASYLEGIEGRGGNADADYDGYRHLFECLCEECDCTNDPLEQSMDTDGDGAADCADACPGDHTKIDDEGQCGCGMDESDSDDDGYADCNDICPNDPLNDEDMDGVCAPDDQCPEDQAKSVPGECGCGASDDDGNTDGVPDCFQDATDLAPPQSHYDEMSAEEEHVEDEYVEEAPPSESYDGYGTSDASCVGYDWDSGMCYAY